MKPIGTVLTRGELGGESRTIDAEKMTVPAVLSTGQIARDGFIVDQRGWSLDNYRSNPVVLWNHGQGMQNDGVPIGRDDQVAMSQDSLIGVTQFDTEDPQSVRIFNKIKNGFVSTPSVRWKPMRTEVRRVDGKEVLAFVEQDLLEYSWGAVPVDTGAHAIRTMTGEALDIAALMDAAPALDEVLSRMEAAYAELTVDVSRLDDGARERLTRLHANVATLIRVEAPAPGVKEDEVAKRDAQRMADLSERLTETVEKLAEPIDVGRIVVDALAKATGKTPERIRQEQLA